MSAEDHINFFDDREDDEPHSAECKVCGVGGLCWENDNGSWRLLDHRGKVHVCDEKRLHRQVVNDFDVID